MALTVYGTLDVVSSTSFLRSPSRPWQVTICIPNDSRTVEEVQEVLRLELERKTRYLPEVHTVDISIHENYWSSSFFRSLEGYLPHTITKTVIRSVRPGLYEWMYTYFNAGGTLDGITRDDTEDTTAPLHVGCSLTITLDALVTFRARVLDFIRDNPNELESLTILPPLQAGGSHIVYLDTVIQVISTTFSCVSIDVFSALDWTVDDVQEIEYTLNTRRH